MEKKEMGFKEKVETAGDELGKAIKDGGTMILIASEGRNLEDSLCYIKGSPTTAAILLGKCAHLDKNLKKLLGRALIAAAMEEQII